METEVYHCHTGGRELSRGHKKEDKEKNPDLTPAKGGNFSRGGEGDGKKKAAPYERVRLSGLSQLRGTRCGGGAENCPRSRAKKRNEKRSEVVDVGNTLGRGSKKGWGRLREKARSKIERWKRHCRTVGQPEEGRRRDSKTTEKTAARITSRSVCGRNRVCAEDDSKKNRGVIGRLTAFSLCARGKSRSEGATAGEDKIVFVMRRPRSM